MQQQTIETLRQALQESALPFAQQESLASHTTFQIGGNADLFWCTPKTVDQLRRTLALCRKTVCAPIFWATAPTRCLPMRATTAQSSDLRGLNSRFYSGTTA